SGAGDVPAGRRDAASMRRRLCWCGCEGHGMLRKGILHRETAMPLHDHSRPPLRNRPRYKSLNAAWGTFLCNGLNQGGLPPGYRAYPEVTVGVGLEADVATYEDAPRPPLVAPVDFSGLESIEVKVFEDEGGGKLVAAVELVSPA